MKKVIFCAIFSTFLLFETGCKEAIDDAIDCILESAFLKIQAETDGSNPKLVHFEFINNDTEGGFTLNQNINWDFGDGNTTTSTDHKVDHTFNSAGDYTVTASYTLHRGSASCNSTKEKTVTIN